MKQVIILVALSVASHTATAADPWMSNPQTLAADEVSQIEPAVAYNSVHNEFLVVWYAYPATGSPFDIVGVRVDSSGLPLRPSFVISDVSGIEYEPDVAYDPAADHYLVVWTSDNNGPDYDIVGRFIPWDGPSPAFPVFEIQAGTPDQASPSVALNPDAGEFLIAWHNDDVGTPAWISARRWAADGSGPVTPAFDVVSGPDIRAWPAAAWNGPISEYLVVYERLNGGAGYDVWGTRLSGTGTVLGSEIGIAESLDNEGSPDVASCRGDYIVAWTALPGPDTQIHTRAIAGDGTAGATIGHPSQGYDRSYLPYVACNSSGAEHLVSWHSLFPNGHYGVIGSFVELGGDAGENFQIATDTVGTLDFANPVVTFGGQQQAMVAWSSDRPDGTSIDISGRLVGGGIFADGFESGGTSYWFPVVP